MLRLKQIISTCCLLMFFCIAVNGQSRNDRFEAIENQKVAFITKQLRLTPSEAQQFFPLYYQYSKEIQQIKSQKMRGRNNGPARSNSFRPGKDAISFDAKEVEIKKNYRKKFADVLGQSRASQFFSVEEEFIGLLYKELKGRSHRN